MGKNMFDIQISITQAARLNMGQKVDCTQNTVVTIKDKKGCRNLLDTRIRSFMKAAQKPF